MNMLKMVLVVLVVLAVNNAAQAQSCKELCLEYWWHNATTSEVSAAIAEADVNARDKNGGAPLHMAVKFGPPEAVTALLSAGADVNVRNKVGNTPLHIAAAASGPPEAITALLNAGADGSIEDEDGDTPFALANEDRLGSSLYWRLNDAQYN